MTTFKVGDTVRLKPSVTAHEIADVESFPTANILHFMDDVEGGVVLSRRIGCVRCWNVEDLEHIPKTGN